MDNLRKEKKEEEEPLTLIQRGGKTVFVGYGTIACVPLNIASFCTRNHLTVGFKNAVEIQPLVGFFTRSLKQHRTVSNTEKKTFLHFSQDKGRKEEDIKKRKKEV